MLNTPVLFIVFNRPDTTRRVFEAIRQAKPRQLFVAADGPRQDREGEVERCEEVRRIATAVDWDCELRTLFRTENLGCGLGPKIAIDWFFENIEQGIILEDDCLPSTSFFLFCQELLDRYQYTDKVMLISGLNPMCKYDNIETSYIFTRCADIWGWATWRRAWSYYNYDVPEWETHRLKNEFKDYFYNLPHAQEIISGIDAVYQKKLDAWDYQWVFYREIKGGLGIVPHKNLISNIGFGVDATHTFDRSHFLSDLSKYEIDFPLVHPFYPVANSCYEKNLLNYLSKKSKSNLIIRVIRFVTNLFK